MPRSAHRYFALFLSLAAAWVLGFALIAYGQAGQASTKPAAKHRDKSYRQPTDPSQYVGTETCKTCHEDMPSKGFYKTYEDSPHYATMLDTKKGPEWHGCEACHGPGKEHVDGGGDKSKILGLVGYVRGLAKK